eukprot:COSAG02_NODE_1649_length_11501_cov_3.588142_2_plen_145_part_00
MFTLSAPLELPQLTTAMSRVSCDVKLFRPGPRTGRHNYLCSREEAPLPRNTEKPECFHTRIRGCSLSCTATEQLRSLNFNVPHPCSTASCSQILFSVNLDLYDLDQSSRVDYSWNLRIEQHQSKQCKNPPVNARATATFGLALM